MIKNCLTCKYEPKWGKPISEGTDNERRFGKCRWNGLIPNMPVTHIITKKGITRYTDDSGIPGACKVWEAKKG